MPFVQDFLKDNNALVTLLNDTHFIHEGKGFAHHNRHSIANNATLDHLIVTPGNIDIHMRQWSFSPSAGPFTIDVYENTIVSANGTEEPVGNLNRQSNRTSYFKLYINPTVTNVGNQLLSDYAPGTNKIGEDASGTLEWILKRNTNYLFRVTNVAAGATTTVFTMFWYEL